MMIGIVITIAVLAAAVYIYGKTLPEQHTARVSVDLAAPPERVFAVISDIERHPAWRKGVKSVQIDRTNQRVIEKNSFGEMPYFIRTSEFPRVFVTEIDGGPELGFGGTWRYDVEPGPEGSRLTITEEGRVYSPLFRVMSRHIFGYEKTARSYLADLKKHLAIQ